MSEKLTLFGFIGYTAETRKIELTVEEAKKACFWHFSTNDSCFVGDGLTRCNLNQNGTCQRTRPHIILKPNESVKSD